MSTPKSFILSITLFSFLSSHGCGGATPTRPTTLTLPHPNANIPLSVVLVGLPDVVLTQTDASPSLGGDGEFVAPLAQDARAPFNGVLFNGPAVGRIAVEFQAVQQRCLVDRMHDADLLVARYNADVATLQVAMSTQQRTSQVLLNNRDLDVARLNRVISTNENHFVENLAWAGGGVLLGTLLVGGIFLFANIR